MKELLGFKVINLPSWCKDRPILAWLVFACVVRMAYYVIYAQHLSISGDEKFYLLKAIDISNYIKSFIPFLDVNRVAPDLIEKGWFLPGMSIVMTPIFFVFSDSSINLRSVLLTDGLAHLRLYMGILNFGLLVFIIDRLYRLFGRHVAVIAAALAACFPIYVASSFTLWGETIGSELLLLYLLWFIDYAHRIDQGKPVGLDQFLVMGLFLASILYVRPSFIFMLPATLIIIATLYLRAASSIRSLVGAAARYAILVLAVLAGLAPWSYAMSKKFGGLYLTTTSTDMVFPYVYAKGELKKKIFDPNKNIIRNRWFRMYYNYWQEARAEHTSFYHIAKAYKRAALASVTFDEYVANVRSGIRGFFFHDNEFLERFLHLSIPNGSAHAQTKQALFHGFESLNTILWYVLLALSVLILCLPWSMSGNIAAWWLGVPFRLAFCSIAIQPFIVGASGRYYEALIILCVVAVALAAWLLKRIISGDIEYTEVVSYRGDGVLTVVQWLLPMMVVIPLLFIILFVY